ncbi:RNA helicase aquarius [Folsomia candida]|uniref:RNA helicase aquarius n=1 Tax=Folsomia candida TaxID=158441 RepID=UPI000B8F4443|nr:RNA helicase aquarius [Folsomia candida]
MVKLNTATAKTRSRSRAFIPTVDAINQDKITQLSQKYWASNSSDPHLPFDQSVVDDLYINEVVQSSFHTRRIALLEISQYLENYLWPNFDPANSTFSHIMSMVCMVNEKHREGVPVWKAFEGDADKFGKFIYRVLEGLLEEGSVSLKEGCSMMLFLQCAFSSLEIDLVRKQIQTLVSLHVWHCLSEGRREDEFRRYPKWKKYWKSLLKKEENENDDKKLLNQFYRSFVKTLVVNFLDLLDGQDYTQAQLDKDFLLYAERFMELMIDLQALLPTRRYLNVLIDDLHLIVKCQMNQILEHGDGHLFSQLLDRLKFYANFEICNESGDPMTELEVMNEHYKKITSLQQTVFQKFSELRQFALSNVNSVDTKAAIMKSFKSLNFDELKELAGCINLIDNVKKEDVSVQFLLEALVFRYERRVSQIKRLNSMALYPTEEVIWDENVVPADYHSASGQVLALPKLNLQFLTLHDYLLRNFDLFRLESTYQIRQDIEDAVFRLKPWRAEDGSTLFNGWARMASPVVRFAVIQVAKPNLGENRPSRVRADVTVNLNVRTNIKQEWELLRKHDACFLVTVKPPNPQPPSKYDFKGDFISQVGLVCVRGCEIEGMLDANGRVIEEGPDPRPHIPGDTRTFRIVLDPNQYQIDLDNIAHGKEDVYETFNIFLRRKPKENNFKCVLETIRDLMNINCVVPDWLHDVILGYGDPKSAHYSELPNKLNKLDFNDTFLDVNHAIASFPNYKPEMKGSSTSRPIRVTFEGDDGQDSEKKVVVIEPYTILSRGPYPTNQPNLNKIQFTPTQVEAIRSGMQPGLTLVVGPPGTGKTDVATQIISNIYHNFPDQRTLVVTHSNQALNQLFEKVIALDVDERHLLRLGHGEEELETEKDFSRYGRVNYVLAKRLDLLVEVEKLQKSLNVCGDVAYTCETSGFFFVHHVLPNWERFLIKVKAANASVEGNVEVIGQSFPFDKFFADAPQPLFKSKSYEQDMEIAEGCFRYIKRIFEQLDEFRAFELLRTGLDRSRYLLVKEAKIIAMTCTHAALKRRELVDLIFQYDNILMEESAQILEIETFIPLLLQNPEQGRIRLKRWIMIGDHHQLPPVIKNMAFQKYGNMEQSLFARFVRLGVPAVELDAQGRARPSIAQLFQWRYKKLGNLPHVASQPEYLLANPGFAYDYQLINVADFNGVGESEPSPYFFQNLAEAEYVVATYMYMRMLGYPAEKITILTTYNGQKALIKDIIAAKCAKSLLIGEPHKVSTVDKYQGQQNDYILLSLVRTKTVGHLRDARRLIVALSRARLGLYIFARIPLFANCFEMTPAFSILSKRPDKLHLHEREFFPTERKADVKFHEDPVVIKDMQHMAQFVYDIYMTKLDVYRKEEAEKKEKLLQEMRITAEAKRQEEPVPIKFDEDEAMNTVVTPIVDEVASSTKDQVVSENEDDEKMEVDSTIETETTT